jgi:hypothetical protein
MAGSGSASPGAAGADGGSGAAGASGAGASGPGARDVPRTVLRAWDEAEARLFPLVMARPDLYQRSVSAIQLLLGRLRETCLDMPALLAANERGGDLAAADLADAEIRPELVAAAACAMRYRELVASLAAADRLAALARARDAGQSWTVVEENGSLDRLPYVPYQRIEAEVGSGRAVIVSIEPDETLSRAVYRLDRGQIDPAAGGLQIGDPIGSYLDPDSFEAALCQARDQAGEPPSP